MTRAALLAVLILLPAVGSSGQTPSFRAGVDLVQIAVLVRDADGRLVRDLTQADFQIVEQGVPQKVVAFDHVSIPIAAKPAEPQPPRASTPAAAAPDVGSNEASGNRVFVLVLDALHVAPIRTAVVRERAAEFIEKYVGPGDLAAVVSPGGLASATQDFTADKGRLTAAVQQFTSSKVRSAAAEIAEEQAARDRDGIAVAMHDGKDPSDSERAGRAQALADVLEALARHLTRVANRRTALVLFSEGIEYDLGDVLGRVQRYTDDVMRATKRAIDALARANVSVYAIDPRGLSSGGENLIESPLYRATPSFVTGSSPEAEHASSIRVLRDVSESTGGFAAVDRSDFTSAFDRILEETSDYYVLGYAPESRGRSGEFRDITVKVNRPAVRVTARKGYVIASPPRTVGAPATTSSQVEQPMTPPGRGGRLRTSDVLADASTPPRQTNQSTDLTAMLASPLPASGLPIRIQAIPFRGDARKVVVDVVVEVLGRALRFAERGGRYEERVELALLTVDDKAHAANGKNATLNLRLTTEQHQGVKATGVRWISRLELEPGHYQLRVAGRATQTAASGLVAYDVDVPKFESDRLAMSGITVTSLPSMLMATSGEARLNATLKMPASAERTFVYGDQIAFAVEVYVPASSSADVEAYLEGEGPRLRVLKRNVTAFVRQSRVDPVAFSIDTNLIAPGRYVLKIVSTTPADVVQRQVPFEVIVRGK